MFHFADPLVRPTNSLFAGTRKQSRRVEARGGKERRRSSSMASTMRSSTTEMVERKVLEMAQHASFHQHVSYNLSTILHAFTAGKTDPTEIAEAFSRARGLEVITRVVSGEPLAKPPVISLCCQVGRHVMDKFGPGVSQKQAGGLVEALVARLALGISGDVTQTVECQVECARLMSSVAGQTASLLIDSGALGAVEGMLEQLGGNHRPPGSSANDRSERRRAWLLGHGRTPSIHSPAPGRRFAPSWGRGDTRSIMRPCCEALERVSRTDEGKTAFEERGTGGVLLSTIRDFPEALEEGSDAALASALKVVERIFTGKTPEACALSLRAKTEEVSGDDPHRPTFSDYDNCVETVLRVVEATPEAPGAAAATCLWWLSGASRKAPDRALAAILAAGEEALAAAASGAEDDGGEEKHGGGGGGGAEGKAGRRTSTQSATAADVWAWFPRGSGGDEEEGEEEEGDEEGEGVLPARPVEGARFLAALCLCEPGKQCLEDAVERESRQRVAEALVALCESADPLLARACFRIIERLAKAGTGPQVFVEAGALVAAIEAGIRFEVEEDAETVEDAEARAIAAALGTVATLAEAGGKDARPVVDEAFRLSVRCLGRVGEFSGRPAAAAAKSALDVITVRLTRADRPKGAAVGRAVGASATDGGGSAGAEDGQDGCDGDRSESGAAADGDSGVDGVAADGVDAPMEVLKDAGAILAVMKAHSADARVQQAGWRSLIAMDTGRGDVEKFWTGVGDGEQSRRQMLRDCLERHGGDSLVAGQVADILEELGLQGDSDGEGSILTASLSDAPGDEPPRLEVCSEGVEGTYMGEDRAPLGVGDGPTPGGHSEPGDRTGNDDEGVPASGGSPAGGGAGDTAPASLADGVDPAPEDAHPQEAAPAVAEGGGEDGGPEVTGGEGGAAVGAKESSDEGGHEVVDQSEAAAGDSSGGSGPLGEAEERRSGDGRSPEEMLVELSLAGTTALEGGSFSSSEASAGRDLAVVRADDKAADAADGSSSSTDGRSVARSLFGEAGHKAAGDWKGAGKGTAEDETLVGDGAGSSLERPVVPSKEELKLRKSWAKLETLHSDIVGRSHILGGESAQMVAAIPEPSILKKTVGTLLEEAEESEKRDAFAAASLALVAALTAATGALANSQKEVQRYLAMSRDLRDTSTWKDISDAMQWTMDSLKGTVILFTPHTGSGLTKALGLCKNMGAASKLFKEAALQIKIIVVELAGEHEPNTVWRVNPVAFEALPENRKVMMLRHLRSLVVAYDHLSEETRRDLTTALEIIKNREVLNMMGKYCIQSEAAEEKRRQAKLASAEERLKVGTRRPSATRQSIASGRRTPPMGMRSSITEGITSPPSSGFSNVSGSPSTAQAFTPLRGVGTTDSPGSGSTNSRKKSGGRVSPLSSSNLGDGGGSGRKAPPSAPRSTRSTESNSSGNSNSNARSDGTFSSSDVGGGGGVGGTNGSGIPRSVMYHSRRRDTVAAAQGAAGSPALRIRRSKSPISSRRPSGRSKSPSRGGVRRASRSPLPRSKNVG